MLSVVPRDLHFPTLNIVLWLTWRHEVDDGEWLTPLSIIALKNLNFMNICSDGMERGWG
jgi:hypothetical protein